MTIQEILDKVLSSKEDDLKLYFITRYLKENFKKSSKVIDKYLFKVYQVDINDEIRHHLFELTQSQLEYIIRQEYEIVDYDVISDDTEHLFTYSMKNKVFSFSDVVCNQLTGFPPTMLSIEDILQSDHELWAYCVGFRDSEAKDWIYTFRKIQSSKVAVDEKEGMSPLKIIRTYFDTKSQKLKLLKGETVNLDKQIDCIYYEETFYIIKKANFEQIVGLQEEYKEEAKKVVGALRDTHLINGIEMLERKVDENPSIHKKLVRISRIGNINTLNEKSIKKMQTVCKKYGNKLKVKDGKLNIEEENDVELILKMLADYYKVGEVSGKNYGTFAGKEVKPV
ncbi:MAG: DUF4868 domain-containing protein [Paludibacteraceae bacterium]|nr:DUF4868 domain-containing protein [Paludibacteraceae bacterium]